MQCTLVAVVLSFFALSSWASALDIPPELKEIVEAAHSTCKEETGVDEDILNKALKGTMTEDDKLKCFIKCMLQHLQVMKDDGTLDMDLIEATLSPKLKEAGAMDAIDKCKPTAGKDLCKSAYDTLICIKNVNPQLAKFFQ